MGKFKKVIASVLAAIMIITCISIAMPTISYAADEADYTSATDLKLNQINIVTIERTENVWYRFHASPKTEIQLITTRLEGVGLSYHMYDSSFRCFLSHGNDTDSRTIRLGKDTTYYIRVSPDSGGKSIVLNLKMNVEDVPFLENVVVIIQKGLQKQKHY